MSEIVFAYPNYENSVWQGCSHHYGAASVRAVLAARGLRSESVLTGRDCGVSGIADRILETRAPIVGLTCYDENYYLVSLLARALKERRPGLKIIVGGPTATFSDVYIAENNPEVDAVVRGEAEATIPDLVAALLDGDAFRSVPGVTWADGGKAVRNPDAPLLGSGVKGAELDCIPSPYLSGFIPASRVGEVGLQTSRGCVYHCNFCNFTIMSQFRVRYFSVERVLEELSFIADHMGGRLDQPVPIFDDFFSLNLKRVKKILRGMIDLGLPGKMRFLCETRADAVDREFFALLREAGCLAINFGLESADPQVLRHSKKLSFGNREGLQAEEEFLDTVRQSVTWAREEGLSVSVTVILGLPGEGPEEGRKTIEYVDSLKCDTYGHNFLQVFPGTELFQTHDAWGIRVEPSATGLPYVTFPAYNVAEVPFLRNGTIPSLWLERNKLLSGYFSGMPGASARPAVTRLDLSNGLDRAALGSWIEPRGEVLLDYTAAAVPAPGRDFRDFVSRGIPLIRATLLETAEGLPIARDVNRGTPQTSHFASRIHPLSFKDFRLDEPPQDDDSVNQTLWVLGIDDAEDLAAFGRELRQLEEERIYSIPLAWFNRNLVLRDACRWSATPCSSSGPDRRWFLEGKEVRPCFHGGPVGAPADGPAACQERLVAIGRTAEAERGCDACAAGDTCARCPYPFPFETALDYCDFRRAHTLVPAFERILRVKNAFLRSRTRIVSDESASGRSCRIKIDLAWPQGLLFDARPLSPWEEPPAWAASLEKSPFATRAFLLSFPGKAYLVHPDDLAAVELSPALAEIWEALCMRARPEEMERHFCGKYGLAPETWQETLETALGMFRDLGFFGEKEDALAALDREGQENFFLRNTLT